MTSPFFEVHDFGSCRCSDPGCPVHKGSENCVERATMILYRIDMEDETGTAMCDKCADDALNSGLFDIRNEEEEDIQENHTQYGYSEACGYWD